MVGQIGEGDQPTAAAALEERINVLERRVTALAEVVGILARGLEDLPTAGPGQRPATQAARRAHELLLAAELRPHGMAEDAASAAT